MSKETKTAMQEFIENCKTAKEFSKDGYVTYEEVISAVSDYLEKEKQQILDAYTAGEGDAYNEKDKWAVDYFNEKYNP